MDYLEYKGYKGSDTEGSGHSVTCTSGHFLKRFPRFGQRADVFQ